MHDILDVVRAILLIARFLMSCCFNGPPRSPVMNITCNVWWSFFGVLPPGGVPNIVGVACQLQFGLKTFYGVGITPMFLCLPPLTDVANLRPLAFQPDLVECPAGSGRFYTVQFVDDVAKGFPNEYRIAVIFHALPWPTPTP